MHIPRFSLLLALTVWFWCLSVTFFVFIVLRLYWVSWRCRLMFLIKFGKFLSFFSLYSLSSPIFSPPGTFNVCVSVHFSISLGYPRLPSLHYFFFLFLKLDNLNVPISWFAHSSFYLNPEMLYWIFHLLLYFSATEFLIASFL